MLVRVFVLFFVLAGAFGVRAQTVGTSPVILTTTTAGNVVTSGGAPLSKLPAGPLADLLGARTYGPNGNSAGSVLLRDLLTKAPGPNGNITVTAVRAVPWSAIAKGVGRAVPIVGTALTIKELIDAVRCQEAFGGGNECDDGQPQVPQQRYCTAPVTISPNPDYSGVTNYVACGSSGVEVWADLGAKIEDDAAHVISGSCSATPQGGSCSWTIQRPGYTSSGSVGVGLPTTVQVCPAITVNGQTFVPTKGVDDKCPTGVYAPKTNDEVATKVETWGNKGKAVAAAEILEREAVPLTHPTPTFEVPPSVAGDRQTTQHPDGSTTVKDRDWTLEPTPEGYAWRERVRETVYPPGATIPPQGTDPDPAAPTTTTTGPGTTTEYKSCGLPGMPPCKIDETGTPDPTAADPQADALGAMGDWKTCLLSPSTCLPALPSLDWSFSLPVACSPIPLPQFEAEGLGSLDLCQYQPVIHDILSMVWVAAGLFAAVALVLRDSTGGK